MYGTAALRSISMTYHLFWVATSFSRSQGVTEILRTKFHETVYPKLIKLIYLSDSGVFREISIYPIGVLRYCTVSESTLVGRHLISLEIVLLMNIFFVMHMVLRHLPNDCIWSLYIYVNPSLLSRMNAHLH